MEGDDMTAPTTVDGYIAAFPENVQTLLQHIRTTIREALPGVQEVITYQIPTFTLNGHSVTHIAAYKTHIGLYPAPIDDPAFAAELAQYKSGKATAKFRLNQPLPLDLIRRIVLARAQEQAGTQK
ncbi:MAG: DUF1801 domain-containing protein [Roseiflexaceae bacterium]|nr:DUF1801 domain-containing protein [Roseiflexaceae bacterium]